MLKILKVVVVAISFLCNSAEGKRPIAPYHSGLKVQSIIERSEKNKRVLAPIVKVTC
jgi:hypothetical protein